MGRHECTSIVNEGDLDPENAGRPVTPNSRQPREIPRSGCLGTQGSLEWVIGPACVGSESHLSAALQSLGLRGGSPRRPVQAGPFAALLPGQQQGAGRQSPGGCEACSNLGLIFSRKEVDPVVW